MIKSLLILGFLVIAASIAYYLVIFIPEKAEQERIDKKVLSEQVFDADMEKLRDQELKKEADKLKKKVELDTCLDNAHKTYKKGWDEAVKDYPYLDNKLPSSLSSRLDDHLKEDKDECYKRYEIID